MEGKIVCPETSVRNYHYSLCNTPEAHSYQLLRGGSLKSHICACSEKKNIYGTLNSPIIPVMTHPILSVSLKRWVTVEASSNLSCRYIRNTIIQKLENKNLCYKLDNPQWFVNCTVTMTDTGTIIWVMYWKANPKEFCSNTPKSCTCHVCDWTNIKTDWSNPLPHFS